ncbi:hypothetical protein FNV43_RR04440 [Rhamnella rubrinervis]|uniref:NAD(P)-binding domain-containing protein n=1 Tax=Rhamnella rubrinervis TaxID=2594499 RepID=A0A8K0MPS6_9ROSA|nr:hypothetical protein FNV43_RR04440 [Rhamnella rubrinervis]
MASRLSPNPIPVEKFSKHPQQIPLLHFHHWVFVQSVLVSRPFRALEENYRSRYFELSKKKLSNPQIQSRPMVPKLSLLPLISSSLSLEAPVVLVRLLWATSCGIVAERNMKSRLLLRDPKKATALFGEQDEETLQVCKGDTRNPKDLDPSLFEGVTHVICCTGTTAFPSKRWDGDNSPERVDWEGVRNLISALPQSVKRVVLVSSIGVTKFNELPWRPGRLTDGPYTSYDLNTLLKATAGQRRAVLLGRGDKLVGEASRLAVAEACIQALDIEFTEGKAYEINSVEGEGPGSDQQKWRELFKNAQTQ